MNYMANFIKKKWVILLMIAWANVSYAQGTQINFINNSWPEALKQATAQNKYIFVDAYATWCGPCKMLQATTFKDPKAAAFYNSNFVNVALDMERGTHPQLAQNWGMRAYPTLIIFNSKGKIVLNTVGYITSKDLLRFGQEALRRKNDL
jgi:thioredoxin 1